MCAQAGVAFDAAFAIGLLADGQPVVHFQSIQRRIQRHAHAVRLHKQRGPHHFQVRQQRIRRHGKGFVAVAGKVVGAAGAGKALFIQHHVAGQMADAAPAQVARQRHQVVAVKVRVAAAFPVQGAVQGVAARAGVGQQFGAPAVVGASSSSADSVVSSFMVEAGFIGASARCWTIAGPPSCGAIQMATSSGRMAPRLRAWARLGKSRQQAKRGRAS